MKYLKHLLFFLPFLALIVHLPAAAQAGPAIFSPEQGEALRGVVAIKGTSYVTGFRASELAFTYSGDSTGTWFVILSSNVPVFQNDLATWDTTAITDGIYDLRLRVTLSNGNVMDTIVPALRVRNYTAIETPTPSPTAIRTIALKPTTTPTITFTPTLYPTPTILPGNAAIITVFDLTKSIAIGGAAALIFLLVFLLYIKIRRL